MKTRLLLSTLCCFGMLWGAIHADDPGHAPLGDRLDTTGEYVQIQAKRIEGELTIQKKKFDGEKANFDPSEEILSARKKCLQEIENTVLDQSGDEINEQVKAKATYLTTHPGALHYVTAVTYPYGDPVQLEDGSIWSISTSDSYKTLNWLTTDNILIVPNRNPVWYTIYPYCLLNQQTGVSVQATPTSSPWFNGYYSRWIYSIDYYNCQVLLNDGSVWNVPFCDSWILSGYLPGDYVTMGFNDSPGNGLGANILINFNTLQYVYSNCIYY